MCAENWSSCACLKLSRSLSATSVFSSIVVIRENLYTYGSGLKIFPFPWRQSMTSGSIIDMAVWIRSEVEIPHSTDSVGYRLLVQLCETGYLVFQIWNCEFRCWMDKSPKKMLEIESQLRIGRYLCTFFGVVASWSTMAYQGIQSWELKSPYLWRLLLVVLGDISRLGAKICFASIVLVMVIWLRALWWLSFIFGLSRSCLSCSSWSC